MNSGSELDDEEAFRWAGDEVGGRAGARLPAARDAAPLPDGFEGAPNPAPTSSVARTLVTGAVGVGYLAITVGWILGTQFTGSGSRDLGTEVLWQFGEFTAIVAAPLWFGATLTLISAERLGMRLGWWALGVGLLLPWPLLPLLAVVR